MCRWVLYHGAPLALDLLLTKPTHSIIHQSHQSRLREEPLNGDGFGVAWYASEISETPAAFRSVQPAWSNQNLRQLARVTKSETILAHIRAASPGLPVSELNCHPFVSGRLAFMHNGVIAGFDRLKRDIQQSLSDRAFATIHGSTDSEHAFAMFIDLYDGDLVDALDKTIQRITEIADEGSYLNLAVSDGERSAVSRFVSGDARPHSLFVHVGKQYELIDGECQMVEPDTARSAVIIASEPLSSDPGWDEVAPGTILAVEPDGTTSARSVGAGRG